MSEQTDYNAMGTEFVPGDKLPKDSHYKKYQDMVNKGGVPSEQVIEAHVKEKGKEYRQELSGPHPVERFRK